MSQQFKAPFKSQKLDLFFVRWLTGDISHGEREEWKRILSYDSEFREQFADWVKSLRDPAWSHWGIRKAARK